MIRQTITCDTCGIERKQANHWFEAFEHEGELRIRGLVPSKNTRPGMKHLCGQTCLHRLVDDFLAGNLTARLTNTAEEPRGASGFGGEAVPRKAEPAALRSFELDDFESSARLIQTVAAAASRNAAPAPPPSPAKQATHQTRPESSKTSSSPASSSPASSSPASSSPANSSKTSSAKTPQRPKARTAPSSGALSAARPEPAPPTALGIQTDADPVAIRRPSTAPLRPVPPVSDPSSLGPLSLVADSRSAQKSQPSAQLPAAKSSPAFAAIDPALGLSSSSTPARSRRAAAWERERDRERQAALRHPDAKRQKFL